MQKKLNKIVNRTNNYLYKYFSKQKKTELTKPMLYGLLPGGKKVRSKILFDIGSIFCLLYTSPSPRDTAISRMPSSA